MSHRKQKAAPSPETPARPATTAAPTADYRGRRFSQSFCIFHGVGVAVGTPRIWENARGSANGAFALLINGERDLEILITGRSMDEIAHRLRGVQRGAGITLHGSVNPPRLHVREAIQFYAEQVIGHANGSVAPEAPITGIGHTYCTFQAVGRALEPPRFWKPTHGNGAHGAFSFQVGGDRDLEILLTGNSISELKHRVRGVQQGGGLTVQGRIVPPRVSVREAVQFFADQVIWHTAAAPLAVAPAAAPQAAA